MPVSILFLFISLFVLPSVGNSKDATVNANVNKAQEDLAKARKLIKTMRSLEKKASKPSQSSTGDDGTRLHQVASSKSSVGKEESQRYFTVRTLCFVQYWDSIYIYLDS